MTYQFHVVADNRTQATHVANYAIKLGAKAMVVPEMGQASPTTVEVEVEGTPEQGGLVNRLIVAFMEGYNTAFRAGS